MTALRRRIRVVAFAWLLCQVATLSAFLPGECCKAHAEEAAAKAKEASCHESAASTAARATAHEPKEGDACPMHHGSKSHECCTISNACDGPGQQLTTLFAYVGFAQTPQSAPITLESSAAFIAPPAALLYQLSVPDAPPPRN